MTKKALENGSVMVTRKNESFGKISQKTKGNKAHLSRRPFGALGFAKHTPVLHLTNTEVYIKVR